MRYKHLSFLLVYVILSCVSKSDNLEKSEKIILSFSTELSLEDYLDTVSLNSDILQIHALAVSNEYFFILDDKGTPVIKAYSLDDGQFLGGMGVLGSGPGEFQMINRSGFGYRKGQLIVQGLRYMRSYDLIENDGRLSFVNDLESRIPGEMTTANSGFMVSDSRFAGVMNFSEVPYTVFAMGKDTVESFGEYPDLYPDIPIGAYHHLYHAHNSASPNGVFLSEAYLNFPLLAIYNLESGKKKYFEVATDKPQKQDIQADERGRSIRNSFDLYKYTRHIEMSNDLILVDYQEYELTPKTSSEWVRQQLTGRYFLLINVEGEALAKFQVPEWIEKYGITPNNRLIVFHPEISDQLFTVDLNQFK